MEPEQLTPDMEEWALERALAARKQIFNGGAHETQRAGNTIHMAIADGIRQGFRIVQERQITQGDLHDFASDARRLVSELGAMLGQLEIDVPLPGKIVFSGDLRPAPIALRPLHSDDTAVDRFASVMKQKLAAKRDEGAYGWDDKLARSRETLSKMLFEHVAKGDPVDIANFAMMLHERGETVDDVYRFRAVEGNPPPTGVWLHTWRRGERGQSIGMLSHRGGAVPQEPGNVSAPEWVSLDGRTTVTHTTYLPPTHWAPRRVPPLPKD